MFEPRTTKFLCSLLVLLLSSMPITAVATEITPDVISAETTQGIQPEASEAISGSCGDALTWEYAPASCTLTIQGTGSMTYYSENNDQPWSPYLEEIQVLVIKDGVSSIGSYAFLSCANLKSATIPASVTEIRFNAFDGCTSLTDVYYGSTPLNWNAIVGTAYEPLASANIHFTASGVCGKNLTWEIEESTGVLTIRGTGEMNGFGPLSASPAPWSDYASVITRVIVEEGVTNIGSGAFGTTKRVSPVYSLLTSVSLPSTLVTIDDFSFNRCPVLTSINIPDSVVGIGAAAFKGCAALEKLALPDGLSEIHYQAFQESGLKKIALPNSLSTLGSSAFENCDALAEVLIAGGLTLIDEYTFADCDALTSVIIPSGVTEIGIEAFFHCDQLGSVILPESLITIRESAFMTCRNLKQITIPASVTSIEGYAFDACSSLSLIRFEGNAPSISSTAFYAVTAQALYPQSNDTWTEETKQQYGGSLAWSSGFSLNAAPRSSDGKPKISWEAVPNAVRYRVYRADHGTRQYSLLKTVTGTSFANTGAVAGQTYDYYIEALSEEGSVQFSQVVSCTCALPQPALQISNVPSSGKIRLTWTAVDGATAYEIYRSSSKEGSYQRIYSTSSTRFTNTSVAAGKTFYYKLKAIHSDPGANSALSSPKYRTCDLPQPVIKLSNVASTGKIKISWEPIDSAVKYEVYRSTSKNGTYTKMGSTTKNSYVNNSSKAGKLYYYKVKALHTRSAANSAFSSPKYRTCDLAQPVVTISRTASGKPKLTWGAVDGAVKYQIYRATSKNGTYKKMYTTAKTSYTNTSATAGKTYYYKVRAVHSNTSANSVYSTIVYKKAK